MPKSKKPSFSTRKHGTNEACIKAREHYLSRKGPQAKADRAADLAEERAKRSPAEQIKRLDMINGKGQGAKKERARLAALLLQMLKKRLPVR